MAAKQEPAILVPALRALPQGMRSPLLGCQIDLVVLPQSKPPPACSIYILCSWMSDAPDSKHTICKQGLCHAVIFMLLTMILHTTIAHVALEFFTVRCAACTGRRCCLGWPGLLQKSESKVANSLCSGVVICVTAGEQEERGPLDHGSCREGGRHGRPPGQHCGSGGAHQPPYLIPQETLRTAMDFMTLRKSIFRDVSHSDRTTAWHAV
jgi:hypothetical protein